MVYRNVTLAVAIALTFSLFGCVNNPDPVGTTDAASTDASDSDVFSQMDPDVDTGDRCKDKVCDDQKPCTSDSCDDVTGECSFIPLGSEPCNDGNICTQDDICDAKGDCVGGLDVDCDDDNPCTEDECSSATGCLNKPNTDDCDDGNACTEVDLCKNGQCLGGGELSCDDGVDCTLDLCDPSSGCASLADDSLCDDGDVCTTATCVADTGCDVTVLSGSCDDGNECTEGDACGVDGCAGAELTCDDGDACTDEFCDPANGCQISFNTASCEDGNACTQGDTCSGGLCVTGGPVDCDDANACTVEFCDDLAGCIINDLLCADGLTCTTDSCDPAVGCIATPVDAECDDNNVCTADTCSDTDGCVNTLIPDTCSDGDACTADLCDAAAGCSNPDSSDDCDDDNACTGDTCDPATGCVFTDGSDSCTDGNACTSDGCDPAQGCVFEDTSGDCTDGNACTTDSCDPDAGCVFTDSSSDCEDGDACTADACDPLTGCTSEDIADQCDDGNPCTDDSCNSLIGCSFLGNIASCDDNDACTEADTCNPVTAACEGASVDCDDGNVCTTDSCDVATGCLNSDNTETCDDGDACTAGDVCGGGACAGATVDCDDGIDCTADTCDSTSGCVQTPDDAGCEDSNLCTTDTCDTTEGCLNENNTLPCDDGDACTSNDACNGGSCESDVTDCDDGIDCTLDTCDSALGCQNTPDDASCDDGDVCSTDTCSATNGCNNDMPDSVNGDSTGFDATVLPGAENFFDNTGLAVGQGPFTVEGGLGGPTSDTEADGSVTIGNIASVFASITYSLDLTGLAGELQGEMKAIGGTDGPVVMACYYENGSGEFVNVLCSGDASLYTELPVGCDTPVALDGTLLSFTLPAGTAKLSCTHYTNAITDIITIEKLMVSEAANGGVPCDDGSACSTGDTCGPFGCVGTGNLDCDDGDACTLDDCDPDSGCTTTDNSSSCDDNIACTVDSCDPGTGDCSSDNSACFGLVINEVDYDQPGSDSGEFLELYNSGAESIALDGIQVQGVNGSTDVGYSTTDLGPLGSLEPGEFLVIGSPTLVGTVPAGTKTLLFPSASNNIQNGAPDGLQVVLTDGTVLDSLSYEGTMSDVGEGSAPAAEDSNSVEGSLVRCPDGVDTDDNGADFSFTPVPTPGDFNACDALCDDADECTTDAFDNGVGACVNTPVVCDDGNECTVDTCDAVAGCQNDPAGNALGTTIGFNTFELSGSYNFFNGSVLALGQGPFYAVGASGSSSDPDQSLPLTLGNFALNGYLTYGLDLTGLSGPMTGTIEAVHQGAGNAHACYYNDGTGNLINLVCGGDPAQFAELDSGGCDSPVEFDGTSLTFAIPEGTPDLFCNHVAAATTDVITISVLTVSEGSGGNVPCDDGDACTDASECVDGACLGSNTVDCDDGIACTTDSCDPLQGCVNLEDDAQCTATGLCAVGVCDAGTGGCVVDDVPNCCGNGVIESGEECDDSNDVDGDGCSATCTLPFVATCDGGLPPIFVGGNHETNVWSTSVTVPTPTDIEPGDVLIMAVSTANGQLVVPDVGWTELAHNLSNPPFCIASQYTTTQILYKVVGDNPEAEVTATFGGSTYSIVIVSAYRNLDPDNPIEDFTFNITSGTYETLPVTTELDNTLLITVLGALWGTNTWTGPAEWTEDSPGAERTGMFHRIQTESGESAPAAFIPSNSDSGHTYLLQMNTCTKCGDNSVDAGEECDDGNLSNGDGCNDLCQTVICGNGIVEPGEMCDDSNTDNGDGCNEDCNIEWECDLNSPVTLVGTSNDIIGWCYEDPDRLIFERPEGLKKNDFMTVLISSFKSDEVIAPPGWNYYYSSQDAWIETSVFYKFAEYDEPETYEFEFLNIPTINDPEGSASGVLSVYRNVTPNNPIMDFSTKVTGGYQTSEDGYIPAPVTTTEEDTMILFMMSSTVGNNVMTLPAEWTAVYPGGNNAGTAAVFYTLQAASGESAPVTAVPETLDIGHAHMMALNSCATTSLAPECGNGIPEAGEECDDSNTVDGDGCSSTCAVELQTVTYSFKGTWNWNGDVVDYKVQFEHEGFITGNETILAADMIECSTALAPYTCDGALFNTDPTGCIGNACDPYEQVSLQVDGSGLISFYFPNGDFSTPGVHESTSISIGMLCVSVEGDGNCDLFFGCETDGDCADGDACTDDVCNVDGECENTTSNCDDGDDCTADSCDALVGCLNDAIPNCCGDGIAEGTEQCDDGDLDNTNACLDSCVDNVCGDGYLYSGVEVCDDGAETAICNVDCTLSSCGDGTTNGSAGEECDDGNNNDGDGCASNCIVELETVTYFFKGSWLWSGIGSVDYEIEVQHNGFITENTQFNDGEMIQCTSSDGIGCSVSLFNTDSTSLGTFPSESYEQVGLSYNGGYIFFYFGEGDFSVPGIHQTAFLTPGTLCISVEGDGNCELFFGCESDLDCEDGDACTEDTCESDGTCSTVTADCDDGVACTEDTCDGDLGCVSTPSNSLCEDGDTCTVDTCDPVLGCTASVNPICCGGVNECNSANTENAPGAYSSMIQKAVPAAGDSFGWDVAIDGEWMVSSEIGDAVHMYKLESGVWEFKQTLDRPTTYPWGLYGQRVALDQGRLAVSSPQENGGGQIYIYQVENDTWALTATILADDPNSYDQLGVSMELNGDTLVAGAPGDNELGDLTGAAYVFREVNGLWTQVAKVLNPAPAAGDQFGQTVAYDNGVLAVGAPADWQPDAWTGAVRVYNEDGGNWTFDSLLLPANMSSGNDFGYGLALEGDTLVGGAIYSDLYANTGYAVVYRKINGVWTEAETLQAPQDDAGSQDHFGNNVKLKNGRLVIGAPAYDPVVSGYGGAGSVVVFDEVGGSFTLTDVLTQPAGAVDHQFGFSIGFDGVHIVASVDTGAIAGTNSSYLVGTLGVTGFDGHGAVYVVEAGNVCNPDGSCMCLDGYTGDTCDDVSVSGTPVNYSWTGVNSTGLVTMSFDLDWPDTITEDTAVQVGDMNSCVASNGWPCTSVTFYPGSPGWASNPNATQVDIHLDMNGSGPMIWSYYFDAGSFTTPGTYDGIEGTGDSVLVTTLLP